MANRFQRLFVEENDRTRLINLLYFFLSSSKTLKIQFFLVYLLNH